MIQRKAWVGLVLLGCCARPMPIGSEPTPKAVAAPKPKPPALRIPPGCEASLAGQWRHEEDPTFSYQFDDDLGAVTVRVYRVFPPAEDAGASDGGAAPLPTAVMQLRRTPDGFVGQTEQLHLLASGTECRATFATRVTACGPSSLTLSSAGSTPVGEGCQTPSSPQPAAMLEHRLARTDAGAL